MIDSVSELATVEHGRQVAERLMAQKAPPSDGFKRVSIADIFSNPATPIEFVWDQLLPKRHTAILPADGGTGKSQFGIILGVHAAASIVTFAGKQVKAGKVVIFSGEDDTNVIRGRLARVCKAYGVDPGRIAERLLIIDATECATLFSEQWDEDTGRSVSATAVMKRLREEVKAFGADLVIVDNASDVFDANENIRREVRTFIRELDKMARDCNAAVLLLAHLDKASVRDPAGKAQYSGSSQWHNSARSRLLLTPDRNQDGRLVLTHEKSNHGRRSAPIYFDWSADGVLMWAGLVQSGPVMPSDEVADQVLTLIRTYYDKGRYISSSFASATKDGAYAVLSADPAYPNGLNKRSLERLLRAAQAADRVQVEVYRCPIGRRDRERWFVPPASG